MAAAGQAKSGGRQAGTPNRPKAATPATAGAKPKSARGLVITYEPLDDLAEYERNARTHSPAQISEIERSLVEFGWATSMAKAKGVLIYGHARRQAAINLRDRGVAIPHNPDPDRGPVVDLSHLTKIQRQAYVLADNQLATKAGWNFDLLGVELGELRDLGFDLSLTGFDLPEIGRLLGPDAGNTDPDDAPAVQAVAVSRTGDVWRLGRHTLHCGDCRDVLPTLAGVDAVVTDPPYGMAATGAAVRGSGRWQLKTAKSAWPTEGLSWDGESPEIVKSLPALAPGRSIIWGGQFHGLPVGRGWLVWNKIIRNWSASECELAWTDLEQPVKAFDFSHGQLATEGKNHPTQKPVSLIAWCVGFIPKKAAMILDPFAGSGTTIIACEQTGRACVAVEISGQYCDVAIRRWQLFCGGTATLEHDGRSFGEIATERASLAA
jgi:hypothetical protein